MNEQLEIINFGENTPIRLKSIYLEQMDSHWHKGIELLLVLSGEVTVICGGTPFYLKEDDLMLINEYSIHSLKSEAGCNLVSLQINTQSIVGKDDKLFFDCNSATDNNKGKFYNLKRLIAELVKTNSSHNDSNVFYNYSIVYNIFYDLSRNFQCEQGSTISRKYFDRVNSIITFIDEHYRDNITLADLAAHEHLSVPYLSSFFEKQLGMNFLTYYNELRFERAVNELLSTDFSVEEISLNNGFPDPRSFVNLFKKKYNCIPSVYRKELLSGKIKKPSGVLHTAELEKSESTLLILAKYLPDPTQNNDVEQRYIPDTKIVNRENISISSSSTHLKHTFKTFTTVARAKELLLSDVQQMLTEIQRNIGYEYIKFHGLLSDDMLVYDEDSMGNPRYSFVYVDKVIDFLLSINLKPLIELTFMPKALALNPERTIYSSPFIVSLPKDLKKWYDFISALTSHFIERYGSRTVRGWLFTVWNEPDTSTTLFGFENDKDFYDFYKTTYDAIKNVNKAIIVGSPSLLVPYNINRIWIRNFITWCHENNCPPDFMNIHFYDNDYSDESLSQHTPAHPAHDRLNMDENSFHKCIDITKALFDELNVGNLPVYLTEWNLTVSHRNLLNDTCFKSCYLAKNLLENYDRLDSFGYWVLTDAIEETQPSAEQFHGGLGLYTTNGIKKPHFYTFDFINRLGNSFIEKGDGYFITKSHKKIQIILYNYEHFNHLFAAGETFDMTFTKRYTPFSELGKMSASLQLCDIPAKTCTVREHILNQKHGSAFDEWVRMGAPKLNVESIEYLKRICVPKLEIRNENFDNGILSIHADLEPLEVRFIEISY
ncbi:MAG: helix-turn-helix domain-containing protein [Clostridia bacterium]|nr:helix-turn-helix domain-containing protein [Clostridia bacterium]